MNTYEYLLNDINTIKGIGPKLSKLFRKKNINTIFDLLWSTPRDATDRTNLVKINELQIGKTQTICVDIIKYNYHIRWNPLLSAMMESSKCSLNQIIIKTR